MAEAQPSIDAVDNDVARVADELGSPPTATQYEAKGAFSLDAVYEHAPTLAVFLDERGYDLSDRARSVPRHEREIKRDLKRVNEAVEGPLTTDTYAEHGHFSPRTVYNRIDVDDDDVEPEQSKWAATLEAAGIEVESLLRKGSNPSLVCPNCASRHDDLGRRASGYHTCPDCGESFSQERGRLAFLINTDMVGPLADGPKPQSALLDAHIPDQMRDLVCRLQVPRPTHRGVSKWDGLAEAEDILFLVGDERAAMRHFVEVNETFVEDCMSREQQSPLGRWPEERQMLLEQQWVRKNTK